MRKLFSFIVIFLFSILLILIVIMTLAIEAQPRVDRQVILTPKNIERAKQIFDTHRDQMAAGQLSIANLNTKDVDIAANYLANRFTNGSAQVSFINKKASILLSSPTPIKLIGGYINIEANLIQTASLPQLQSARIGNLVLPEFLVSQLNNWFKNRPDIRKGLNAIKLVQISPLEISITYHRWNNNSLTPEIKIPFFSKKAQAQIYRYHMRLVKISQESGAQTITLSEILSPLMRVAAQHSINGDALAENQAAILATTLHVLKMPLKLLIPDAVTWPHSPNLSVTLDGRTDFAKHFIASAAITAYTDTTLSNAIGLYKEIADSQYGSGFSFSDIAANRAGTRFGHKAVASKTDALQLQQLVAAGLNDSDLMPPWSDLPEHMSEKEFKAHFRDTNTIIYQNMINEIESRISKLRLLR